MCQNLPRNGAYTWLGSSPRRSHLRWGLTHVCCMAGGRNSGGARDLGAQPAAGERGAQSAQHAAGRCAGGHPGIQKSPHGRAPGPLPCCCSHCLNHGIVRFPNHESMSWGPQDAADARPECMPSSPTVAIIVRLLTHKQMACTHVVSCHAASSEDI